MNDNKIADTGADNERGDKALQLKANRANVSGWESFTLQAQ